MFNAIIKVGSTFVVLATALATLVWWVNHEVEILSPMQHLVSVASFRQPATRPDDKNAPPQQPPAGSAPVADALPTLLPAELANPTLEQLLPVPAQRSGTKQNPATPGQTLDEIFGLTAPIDLHSPPALQSSLPAMTNFALPAARQVWVDTTTKLYYCAGERDYGRSSTGFYMPDTTATAAGFRANDRKNCP
jgi:hypothetical protein